MAWLNFGDKSKTEAVDPLISGMIEGWSIEVMPRTAAKIEDFRAILPEGTRVYIAHIDGTPFEEMLATAKRLNAEGYAVMPHLPARSIKDTAELEDWLKRYQGEANVDQALLLGGGNVTPTGTLTSSMDMIETGLFDKMGFKRLHIAGHPEGNKDIDGDGSSRLVDQALLWKQDFASRTDADVAIATQFAFDAKSVTDWAERIQALGVTIPVHVGVAGPTKLQTLIKFAIACGVGPSLKVLQKRAMDLSKLLVPYEPTDVISGLAQYKKANPKSLIEQIHVFPLGGINPSAEWMNKHGASGKLAKVA